MIVNIDGEEEKTMSRVSEFLLWTCVIVLAFVPGGIFIAMFLLAIYYGPMLFAGRDIYIIRDVTRDKEEQQSPQRMNEYDSETLDDMK